MAEKTRVNGAGLLEGYDEETGEVLWVQELKDGKLPARSTKNRNKRNQRGIPAWSYTPRIGTHICELIAQGETVNSLGSRTNLPSRATIHRWMAQYPDFRKMVEEARKLRADAFHDKAIEAAEKATKDEIQVDKLKVDTYKWAAEVNDPDSYGRGRKTDGGVGSVTFVINTGINREETPVEVQVNRGALIERGGSDE